jgi:hypothetical protein
MTTPMDAWFDAAEMTRLAGKLLEPSAGPAMAGDPSFGGDFVGFADDDSAAPGLPDTLRAALGGLRQCFLGGFFILNDQGGAVMAEGDAARFQTLAEAFARTGGNAAVRLKINAASWLELVPVGQGESRRVFGAVTAGPLETVALERIKAALAE